MSPPLNSPVPLAAGLEVFRPRLVSLSDPASIDTTVDGLAASFNAQVTDWRSLGALLAGGLAYRATRVGVMSLGTGSALRAVSVGAGLSAEVSIYEGVHRGLTPVSANPNLWSWNGSGGLRQGLLQSFITFTALKGAGALAQGENLVARHLLQDSAMVLGHNGAAAFGIAPRPTASLAEQFLTAEATNLQLGAVLPLSHRLIPGLSALERGLDLSLRSSSAAREIRTGPDVRNPLNPLSALAIEGPSGNLRTVRSPEEGPEIPTTVMMSIKDFWSRLTGQPPAPSERPSERPTVPARPSPYLGYFQSYYHPDEVFPLGRITEGQEKTFGRSLSTVEDLFPAYYRNISRRHLTLRVREDRVEIQSAAGLQSLKINGESLSPYFWYLLRHGDFVEFVGDGHRHNELDPADFAGEAIQEGSRPALFRFFKAGETSVPSPEASAERAPLDTSETLRDLHGFQSRLAGMVSLYSRGLREVESFLKGISAENRVGLRLSNQMLTVADIVQLHRHLAGPQEKTVLIEEENENVTITRPIRVPAIEGFLRARLDFFEEVVNLHENRFGLSSEVAIARRDLGNMKDQLDRMYRTLQIYRRFFQTPEESALLNAVEGAYAGLNVEAVLREERVRSETRSLDLTLTQAERESWTREFLTNVLEPRIVRNVMILTGQVPAVQGRPVAGSFYRAVSQGTISDGLRSVRALVDPESGEFLGFHDESSASRRIFEQWAAEGHPMEEISFLIDVAGTGRITQVIVPEKGLRSSIRADLLALRDLQVLPPGPLRVREGSDPFDTVFGSTEYRDLENSEIWRMNFPTSPDDNLLELGQVVALTPLRESAGPSGRTEWTLVTLDLNGETPAALQIWARSRELHALAPGSLVRLTRMR